MEKTRVRKKKMAELEQMASSRSSLTGRDASPDSVIYTLESSFSLFSSSTSASVERCSFASEPHDPDSLFSEISLHLEGHNGENHEKSSSGPNSNPNPDPNKSTLGNKHSSLNFQILQDENPAVNSPRNSFSLAHKECHDHRSRSEVSSSRKLDRRRPASLDLNNNVAASSPRLAAVKKTPAAIAVVSRKAAGTFPSPGTPSYKHSSVGMQKGWSSERVPLHNNAGRKQHVNPALLTLNSGRTLPSKWEDAERWIFSPVSGDGIARHSIPLPQRRPKSKSGPLGPPGTAYYSMYSPAVPAFEGRNFGNFTTGSPFSAGVISTKGLAIHSGGHEGAFHGQAEPSMARSVSVHGCSEMLDLLSSTTGMQELGDNLNMVKDAATNVSRVVSRRDMATQMSPESSPHSSPKMKPLSSASSFSAMQMLELGAVSSSRLEIRDVEVDNQVSMTRWSKKYKAPFPGKDSIHDRRKKNVDAVAQDLALDVPNTARNISKTKREEAKITAWENLQKAKADAAIRKLEMKLEKKRASSMDKIMNKLRSAQKKAQEMRSSVLANQSQQVTRTSHNILSFHRTRQMGSLSGCFTCHAF